MYRRNIKQRLLDALKDTPVALLHGARQVGKSTLARSLVDEHVGARYLSLDDPGTLAAASADPVGFIAGLGNFTVIDEIQKAPGLFPVIKAAVDRDRRPGRLLLTGSANVLLLPKLSESLAGRMEILSLWPLSQGELAGRQESFIDRMFADTPLPALASAKEPPGTIDRALLGGFPEALRRASGERREAWFSSYIATILQRDIRDLSNIAGLTEMPRLLSTLAARSATLHNSAEISRSTGLPYATLNRYLALLEMIHLVRRIHAWSGNLARRQVKAPKLHLCDTGLMAHLCDLDGLRLTNNPALAGQLLESFVAQELIKQSTWAETRVNLFHFRESTGREVDLLLERAGGNLVGIEVKAAATIGQGDFKGLRTLAEALGDRFIRGVLLYGGEDVLPFGDRLVALPMRMLWQ